MEFGSGHDVRPGEDITMETASGTEDLGQATYDSDHDGVGDSVIIIDGDHQYLITDGDHDGYADSVRAFDSSGHEIDPRTGDPIGTAGTSAGGPDSAGSDPAGSDPAGTGAAGSGAAGSDPAGTGADHSGAARSGSEDSTGPSGTDAGSNVQQGFDADGMTVVGDDGSAVGVGTATVDLDRDGTPDTAVVREPDGAVIGYTDRDGDGIADQRTRIGVDGDVVISLRDGDGGWEVAATGHLDDTGTLVQDPVPAVITSI